MDETGPKLATFEPLAATSTNETPTILPSPSVAADALCVLQNLPYSKTMKDHAVGGVATRKERGASQFQVRCLLVAGRERGGSGDGGGDN